ncbi:MAG TPA: HAD family phosphatase [Patescibacteria group bacterium]|nr:HAD family phosphatase [Patescibacteria group bacterium]
MKSEKLISKELPSNIRAVLFDYDGVVADTMQDNLHAWQQAFSDAGVNITAEEYYSREGMTPSAIARELGTQKGLSEEVIADIPTKKAQYYRSNNSFRLYPEVTNIVKKIKDRGLKLALVTGALRHRVEEMTPKDLLELFDVVISADDITYPKPDPEPYQKALEKLNVQPSEAVVIENAPLGIESAKRAGCFVVAIETTLPQSRLIQADTIIKSHEHLPGLFDIL